MNKKLLQESIKQIEESVKVSRDNLEKATQHIEEGEVILEALKKKLKEIKLKNCTFEKISTDDAKKLFVDRFFELKNSIKL